jgi:hypothetical protein
MPQEVDLNEVRRDDFESIKSSIDDCLIELSEHVWQNSKMNPANLNEGSWRTLLVYKDVDQHLEADKTISNIEDEPLRSARLINAAKIAKDAYELAAHLIETDYHSGRRQKGIAVACIYASSLLNNWKLKQSFLSDFFGVSRRSIRNHYQEAIDLKYEQHGDKETVEITFTDGVGPVETDN